MEMFDTPRTDAASFDAAPGGPQVVSVEFAQQLERELAALAQTPNRLFWVVERWEDERSVGYWTGGHSRSFTTDINKAAQFCRHEDAFWITKGWHWGDTKIVQHMTVSECCRGLAPDRECKCFLEERSRG